jgi:hypothetical protein
MKKICSYGCGKEGKHQLKNGKWCCEFSQNSCEAKKKRRLIKIDHPKTEFCENGCGQPAVHQLKNGKWICDENYRKCPINRKKYGHTKNIGSKRSIETRIKIGLKGKEKKGKFKPELIELCRIRMTGKGNPRYGKTFKHKPDFFIKMRKTMEERGYWTKLEDLDGYEKYKRQVYHFTNISVSEKFTKEDLKNRGRISGKHIHIDHIFSIIEGFKLKIDPKIIGCKSNVRILSVHDNCSKHKKSEITKEELFKRYEEEVKDENVEYSS